MYNLVLLLFCFFIVFGVSTILLLYYRKIGMNWYYPAGFVFIAISGAIYYFIPEKSNFFVSVTAASKLWIGLITAILVTLTLLFAIKRKLISPMHNSNYRLYALGILAFYVSVAAISQEFMYRTFLYDVTKYLFPRYHYVSFLLFSTVLFTITHITYRDRLFLLSATLLGIILSVVYVFVPNLMVVTLVHAILGAVGIALGYVRIEGKSGLL